MAILLSFGVLFPPIAVVGCIAIVVQVIYQKILVLDLTQTCETWLSNTAHHSDSDSDPIQLQAKNEIESIIKQAKESCGRFPHIYSQTMKNIVFYACIVWGLFLWDIVGGEVGAVKSIWTFLLVNVGVLLRSYERLGTENLLNRWWARRNEEKDGVTNGNGSSSITIELTSIDKKDVDEVGGVIVENPLYSVTKLSC